MAVTSTSSQKTIQEIVDSSKTTSSTRNTGNLGKDDFLNLLVTQLRYQDPLNPMEDKEFIAQMAQFSALEQMQNMSTAMSQSQAFSLIGKYVVANVTDEDSGEVSQVQGLVSSVKMSDGKTYVVVNNKDISVDQITNVTDASSVSQTSNLSAYTNLIGYNVKGAVYDSSTSHVIPVTGVVTALEKGTYEDYAVMDDVTVEISGIDTDTPYTDPDFVTEYLDERLPTDTQPGKEVEVIVVNRSTEQKVPVKAILKSYEVNEDGKVTVTLDNLHVSVDSISKITK